MYTFLKVLVVIRLLSLLTPFALFALLGIFFLFIPPVYYLTLILDIVIIGFCFIRKAEDMKNKRMCTLLSFANALLGAFVMFRVITTILSGI